MASVERGGPFGYLGMLNFIYKFCSTWNFPIGL